MPRCKACDSCPLSRGVDRRHPVLLTDRLFDRYHLSKCHVCGAVRVNRQPGSSSISSTAKATLNCFLPKRSPRSDFPPPHKKDRRCAYYSGISYELSSLLTTRAFRAYELLHTCKNYPPRTKHAYEGRCVVGTPYIERKRLPFACTVTPYHTHFRTWGIPRKRKQTQTQTSCHPSSQPQNYHQSTSIAI